MLALLHADRDLVDAEAGPVEEEDDLGLGVVLGIPVGEGLDDALNPKLSRERT